MAHLQSAVIWIFDLSPAARNYEALHSVIGSCHSFQPHFFGSPTSPGATTCRRDISAPVSFHFASSESGTCNYLLLFVRMGQRYLVSKPSYVILLLLVLNPLYRPFSNRQTVRSASPV